MGARPAGRADRRHPHAGDLRQRRVRRPRPDDPVPDDHDVGAHDGDQGQGRAPPRRELNYTGGSRTVSTASTDTWSTTCRVPDGHSTKTRSTVVAAPRPMSTARW